MEQKSAKGKVDYTEIIEKLNEQVLVKRSELTKHLTSWQRVQLSRHPDRPYTLKYIEKMTSHFIEMYGSSTYKIYREGPIIYDAMLNQTNLQFL